MKKAQCDAPEILRVSYYPVGMSHSGPSAVAITLSEAERAELVRRTELPHRRSAEKARILLACADGMSNAGVARLVGVQAKTVGKWRRAFAAQQMAGLEDVGWIGRPKADLVLVRARPTRPEARRQRDETTSHPPATTRRPPATPRPS
ncbi:helix-turn-helix domain-containing protein [Streptomyces sp. NPDC094468]|uniref:helix-turn-helix domain-containing protein n=1 Tax=Streptomyces sp. NPDC094468 TaxID=3366066 RepID=UPI0038028A07